ncbi:MAG: SDR family oxidoreductase, partial [Thermoanaerobaculia bacterium]|nr:SDR family oxidoreductase [Thermoanaerobaculia bacterium]
MPEARLLSLEGRTALVTGASGAMGGAISRSLARRGANLVLSGRNEKRLERTADSARALGIRVVVVARDLTEVGAVEILAERAEELFGGVDLLVHALGTFHSGEIAETAAPELEGQLAVNLRVPWALTRRLLPGVKERRGEIVFVNSTVGLGARGGVGAYAASKQALRALADSLRDELGRLEPAE